MSDRKLKPLPPDLFRHQDSAIALFGLVKTNASYDPTDLNHAQSAEQLAELLLVNVGGSPPFTAPEIERAIAANDRFVEELEHIVASR